MWKFIVTRAKERSTWLGLTALLTAFGITLSPDQIESIISAGLGFAGVVGVFTKDKAKGE